MSRIHVPFAASVGLEITSLSSFSLTPLARGGLVLGFARAESDELRVIRNRKTRQYSWHSHCDECGQRSNLPRRTGVLKARQEREGGQP